MRNTLFGVLLLWVLFQRNICYGGEWFYGTWYFDRDFTSNQIDGMMADIAIPKPDKKYLSEFIHSGEAFKPLDGTIYEVSPTNITLTINQEAHKISYKILGRPNTNEVILKYASGYTASFRLTNGLLEIEERRGGFFNFYYSRKKN